MPKVVPEPSSPSSPVMVTDVRSASGLRYSGTTAIPTTSSANVVSEKRRRPIILKTKEHRGEAAVVMQRYFRGYLVRAQWNREIHINDCLTIVESIEKSASGYRALALYMLLISLFLASLVTQQDGAPVYAQQSIIHEYITSFSALAMGESLCPQLRMALLGFSQSICQPTEPIDLFGLESNTATLVAQAMSLCDDFSPSGAAVTLADVRTVNDVYDWIEGFILTVNNNNYEWDVAMPQAEAFSRLLTHNRLVNGMLLSITRSELGACTSALRSDIYPRCRRDDMPLTQPYSTPMTNESIIPEIIRKSCPPFLFDDRFGSYMNLLPSNLATSNANFLISRALADFRFFHALDAQTNSVQLMFLLYNGHSRLIIPVKITFDFDVTGRISTTIDIKPVADKEKSDFSDGLWLTFTVALGIGTLMNIVWTLRQIKKREFSNILSIANCIDVANYVLFWIGVALWVTHINQMSSLQLEKVTLDLLNLDSGVSSIFTTVLFAFDRSNALQRYFAIQSLALALALVRFLRMLRFQPQLALVTDTLINAGSELLQFLFVYTCILVIFAGLGTLLFGSLKRFSTMGDSINTLFAWNVGSFTNDEVFEYSPIIGPIYFFLFIAIVFLMLLNIFLAIILEGYNGVKQSISLQSNSTSAQFRLYRQVILRHLKSFFDGLRGRPKSMIEREEMEAALIRIAERTGRMQWRILELQSLLKKEGLPPAGVEFWSRLQLRFAVRKKPRETREMQKVHNESMSAIERIYDILTIAFPDAAKKIERDSSTVLNQLRLAPSIASIDGMNLASTGSVPE